MYKLFLDDIRNYDLYYAGQNFIVARTYNEAVNIVKMHGLPEFISFDHDLGDNEVPEKLDILSLNF